MIRIQLHTKHEIYGTISLRIGQEWKVSLAENVPVETAVNDLRVWMLSTRPDKLWFDNWNRSVNEVSDALTKYHGYTLNVLGKEHYLTQEVA
jgi:hypothetical protein